MGPDQEEERGTVGGKRRRFYGENERNDFRKSTSRVVAIVRACVRA